MQPVMSFTLAAIALTSPLWLWALCAAAGVPLLAHLLNRLHGRVAVFPTVRFFEQAAAEGRRRVQVRVADVLDALEVTEINITVPAVDDKPANSNRVDRKGDSRTSL